MGARSIIERTEQKLREATFFLVHLEREATTTDPGSREAAAFYLSAFISAARSVTFVLQSEFPSAYPDWSLKWRSSLTKEERQLLERFTTARNRAQKRETPVVSEDYLANAARNASSTLPAELQVFFLEDDLPLTSERVFKSCLAPAYSEAEVLPLCRQYTNLLSRLVTSFVASHK